MAHYRGITEMSGKYGPADVRINEPFHPLAVSRNPKFDALIQEIQRLHASKNHDYAQDTDPLSNLRRAQALGVEPWRGVLVRLSDKWSRLEQLATGKTPKHESMRDSLIDNAIYSLLAVILLDEQSAS